jgi:feruloyl-CoA synthase
MSRYLDVAAPEGQLGGRALPLRSVDLGPLDVVIEPSRRGQFYARSPFDLGPYEAKVTSWLDRWARRRPDHIFLAERGGEAWQTLTYAEAQRKARALAQALLARGLSAERPLVILSGNSIAHALLGLAALYAGIPYAPLSPAYALAAPDFARLKSIIALLTPGLVFAEDGALAAPALAVLPPETPCLVATAPPVRARSEILDDLLATDATAALDLANAAIGPGTIAKFMFTSGSTAAPKAVITTHRMLCANQAMIAHVLRFLRYAPPVLVDWLPWSHSFGGNQNFNLVLAHGGTLYIDAGRPGPQGIAATLANLREVSPTLHFNVPAGIESLLPHLVRDKKLATNFFRRLQLTFFAGAPMARANYEAFDEMAVAACGEKIVTMNGYGATESGPATTFWTPFIRPEGGVGLPLPGSELKLVPHGEKREVRARGPNVTPGYWRDARATEQAFDDDGFFRLGDALRFADATTPKQGFCFDGRIGEDFKLATGTWVSTGPLRDAFLAAFAPFAQDVVIAGEGEAFAAALVFPNFEACQSLAAGVATSPAEIIAHPHVRAKFQALLDGFAGRAEGASRRIARLVLLPTPASTAAGELTGKGSLNRAAVLANRAGEATGLLSATPSAQVIIASAGPTNASFGTTG